MSSSSARQESTSEFVQLLREFLVAHAALDRLFEDQAAEGLLFSALRELVGDDHRSVLFRLKQRSHALFRADEFRAEEAGVRDVVRRESLFDLAIGSLFHEAMKLRESLYQCEVYGPRVETLRRDGVDDEGEVLLAEFDRILAKSRSRIHEVSAEVRILLAQTRDQLRRLLVDRAGERLVTRFLLSRREQVERTFPEGLDGLLEAMHGSTVTGRVVGARSLVEGAYFVEARRVLREAGDLPGAPRAEVDQLARYAEGMQAFLDGDYDTSLEALERWVELGAQERERDFARLAASALGRISRLVEPDAAGQAIAARAKELQRRLDAVSA